ncbi:uncharacterized protein [Patagioenas fasciata]|uniref:uncharacterized protein isoform X1 n=1 Tax=Patagioenas fasciata TaxID=372321 RepID=UPI003A9A0340
MGRGSRGGQSPSRGAVGTLLGRLRANQPRRCGSGAFPARRCGRQTRCYGCGALRAGPRAAQPPSLWERGPSSAGGAQHGGAAGERGAERRPERAGVRHGRLPVPPRCHPRQIKAPCGLCCSQIQTGQSPWLNLCGRPFTILPR